METANKKITDFKEGLQVFLLKVFATKTHKIVAELLLFETGTVWTLCFEVISKTLQ